MASKLLFPKDFFSNSKNYLSPLKPLMISNVPKKVLSSHERILAKPKKKIELNCIPEVEEEKKRKPTQKLKAIYRTKVILTHESRDIRKNSLPVTIKKRLATPPSNKMLLLPKIDCKLLTNKVDKNIYEKKINTIFDNIQEIQKIVQLKKAHRCKLASAPNDIFINTHIKNRKKYD